MIRLGKFPEDNFELLFSFLLHMWLNMKNMSNSTSVVFLLLKSGILSFENESNQVWEFYFLKPILKFIWMRVCIWIWVRNDTNFWIFHSYCKHILNVIILFLENYLVHILSEGIFEIILSFSILFLHIPWEHGSITFNTTSSMIWKTCARVFAAHFCITWSWRPTYIWLTLLIFGTITFI